jgi:hypothetical protein
VTPQKPIGEEEDDADRQLQESLARARRVAQQKAAAAKSTAEQVAGDPADGESDECVFVSTF